MEHSFGDMDVEQRVTQLLRGDQADRNEAFHLIHEHFRHALCAAARRHNRSIDLENLWGDTLAWFCSHSQSMDYDASQSPVPLLRTFMVRRAIERRRRNVKEDIILQELANRLRGSNIGAWWQQLSSLDRHDLLAHISRIIATLPQRQRQVCQTFVDHFPETTSMNRLRQLVELEHGGPVSHAAVERALQEARKKVRVIFAEYGF